jgi:anti-sigma regulatory factor (Ser/Thr protein kinase)
MTDVPPDAHVILEGSAAAPSEGRALVVETLARVPERTLTVAQLLVSELVATAVRHGSRRLALAVRRSGDAVRIEVAEQTLEVDRAPVTAIDPDQEEGLSARILEALADRHGHEMRSDGMVSWVEIDIREAGAAEGGPIG